MDEQIIMRFLSNIISRYLDQVDHDWQVDQKKEISERIAEKAWDGLILLLRQTLLETTTVTLSELGRFERNGMEWKFWPAASLEEAAAFTLPAEEGYRASGQSVLHFLRSARELLEVIPSDIQNFALVIAANAEVRGEEHARLALSAAILQELSHIDRKALSLLKADAKEKGRADCFTVDEEGRLSSLRDQLSGSVPRAKAPTETREEDEARKLKKLKELIEKREITW